MISVAFYLPQYHRIPENDVWWGEGFTEWTNTKNAKPVYKGHVQPRTPLGQNYYNLLKEETISWQMKLAREHGLGAFCYYHYWFEGKLLLEKPLELMRTIEDRIPYFFAGQMKPGAEHGTAPI